MSKELKVPYVSVVKLNGKPILPPLITSELRKELLRYKQQAVKLEQWLKKCRDLKKSVDDLLESQIQSDSARPLSQLTFGDSSHIEALNISDTPKPSRKLRNVILSKDLIEVTEYNPNGFQTICPNRSILDECEHGADRKVDCDKKGTKNNREGTELSVGDTESNQEPQNSVTPPKPRLIRSNSYTLENPSPILLEHLKKASCSEFNNVSNTPLTSGRTWASLENNHTPFESSEFSSIKTVVSKEQHDQSDTASSPDKSSKYIDEVKSPTIEVYQTDISVQQITVNTSAHNGLSKEEKRESFFTKDAFGVFEPDSELMSVLKDIPDTYANQILELLRKQHVEQKERLERYDNISEQADKLRSNSDDFRLKNKGEENQLLVVPRSSEKQETLPQEISITSQLQLKSPKKNVATDNLIDLSSFSDFDTLPPDKHLRSGSRPSTTESCQNNTPKVPSEKLRRSSTFSMSPSQSLYYSVTSDSDTLPRHTPSINVSEFNGAYDKLQIGVLRENDGFLEGIVAHQALEKGDQNLGCNRELFPEIDPVTLNALKQEWAASVIQAHVKGYLTRRLIKTERVQTLIATVKDVLMCALELHHSETIDEKDVELHRRLINQLSAALYSFHDVFFELSIQEQMLVIAADRTRRREKVKRPESGRSSIRSKSSNSSRLNTPKTINATRSASKHSLINESPSLTKV